MPTFDDNDLLPPPPYAFATHLLGALGPVRRRYQQMLRQVESLAAMVWSRVLAEEEYATQLERIAGVYSSTLVASSSSGGRGGIASSLLRLGAPKKPPSGGAEDGEEDKGGVGSSFRDCVESVKGDLLKSGVQRRQLAKSMLEEVHGPMDALYQNMAAQGQELEEEAGVLARDLRGLGKRYDEAHRQMERAQERAATLYQQVLEQGLESPTEIGVRASLDSSAGDGKGLSASNPAAKKLASLSSSFMHQVSRADPASWLLPSSTSTAASNKAPGGADHDLVLRAQEQLEAAARCRLACRGRYKELMAGVQRAGRALQVALTRYQLLEEEGIDAISKLLRQAVVFEASCVANEQYELQTTFQVTEAVDKDKDLEAFVAGQLRSKDGGCAANGQQPGETLEAIVASSLGLCLALPPPPALADEEARKAPPHQQSTAAPLLTPADLPNLSAPAPTVLPARLVLRRLMHGSGPAGSRSPTPPPQPLSPVIERLSLSAIDAKPIEAPALPTGPSTAVASKSPILNCSPIPPTFDEDDEEEEEEGDDEEGEEKKDDGDDEEEEEGEEGIGGSPLQQARSLKAVMQKRHEKQRASGALSPLVDIEEFATEKGGKEYAL